MNKGFLNMIDLSLNIQRALHAIRGISSGVAAIMIVGLTLVAAGIFPFMWYFDIDSTLDYAAPLIQHILPTLPVHSVTVGCYIVLAITLLPTVVELLLPRLGATIQAIAFAVFSFIAIDTLTDWPRVVTTMETYKPEFEQYGIVGVILWYPSHVVLLLFATLLFELIFVICVVLIIVLIIRIAVGEMATKNNKSGNVPAGELA